MGTVDGQDREHCIPTDVLMSVGETVLNGHHQRLKQFGLLELKGCMRDQSFSTTLQVRPQQRSCQASKGTDLAQEPKGASSHVLVRVGQVLAICITDKDHLVQQFAIGAKFGNDLPVDEQQLLESVIIFGHHEANDRHQEPRESLTSHH